MNIASDRARLIAKQISTRALFIRNPSQKRSCPSKFLNGALTICIPERLALKFTRMTVSDRELTKFSLLQAFEISISCKEHVLDALQKENKGKFNMNKYQYNPSRLARHLP